METNKEMFSLAMEMKYAFIQWFRHDISDEEYKLRKENLLNKYRNLMSANGSEQKSWC